MTPAPAGRRGAAQLNSDQTGAAGEMAALGQRMDPGGMAGWKMSLLDLSKCDMKAGSDDCRRLVDGLLEIARSGSSAAGAIDEAGEAMAGMFGKFHSDALYNDMLVGMLDRVYMVPGGCEGLDAFFRGIDIENGLHDKYAYFALDVVRVVLRRLFVRDGELRDSRQAALGACYDAMLRAAARNGLGNLAEIMGRASTREGFCGSDPDICRMAMLRVSIYDRRDVPSVAEALRVLDRYPALKGALGPKRVIESLPLLTRLVYHISLSHLAAQKDHAWVYTAVYESNVRVRYWLDKIDLGHGGPAKSRPSAAAPGLEPVAPNTVVAARYLALEIDDFWGLYDANCGLVGGMDIDDPEGVYAAMRRQGGTRKAIREMRERFGARAGWTFEEASARIDGVGLERLVLYAHLVLMFQDAVYRTIPGRYSKNRLHAVRQLQVCAELGPPTTGEEREAGEAYNALSVAFSGEKTQDRYVAMHESALCMLSMYASFVDAVKGHERDALEGYLGFSVEVYSVKYMMLELANFVEQYAGMGVALARGKIAFTPRFLGRRKIYQEFRDGYAGHRRADGIGGLREMVEKTPGLISDMLYDIVEAGALASRLAREFKEHRPCAPRLMTDMETRRMEGRLETVRRAIVEHYGNGFADPGQEQDALRRMEEVRRILGVG